MNKAYNRINWENRPSDATPLNESNLNRIDVAVDELDNRVITHENTKATKEEVSPLFSDVDFDESTGVITFTRRNGATVTIDTKLEKLAVNFSYDPTTEQLIITLDDGTIQYADLSALITQYEFSDTDTVAFSVDAAGKVSAVVKEGSIEEKHLQPNYLADIKVEVAKAQASQQAAATSETNAATSESNAKSSETAAATSENNAKTSETNAKASETAAASSEATATAQATAAGNSAASAATSAVNAATSENNAKTSEANAASSKNAAASSASTAASKATSAADSATLSESYAVGGTGTRTNEDMDNAKYYKEQAERIAEGLKGSLLPMGTIAFADLPDTSNAGYMYNISDEFSTTARFKEGAGHVVPAGANVYYTADGYWDCMAGSPVSSVNGQRGNVSITPENIGALPVDGNAISATKAMQDGNGNNIVDTYQTKTGNTANNSVNFTSGDSASPTGWTDVAQMQSGEKHSSLFNKISTMFKNVRYLYKMLGTTDISAIGGGTVTGAIASQNETFTQHISDLNTDLNNIGNVDNLIQVKGDAVRHLCECDLTKYRIIHLEIISTDGSQCYGSIDIPARLFRSIAKEYRLYFPGNTAYYASVFAVKSSGGFDYFCSTSAMGIGVLGVK